MGRLRHRWKDNIKMDLKDIVYECVDWIHVAQRETNDFPS